MVREPDLLAALDKVAQGGESLQEWATALLARGLSGVQFFSAGGVVVPQVGEGAGSELVVDVTAGPSFMLDEAGQETIRRESAIGANSIWQNLALDPCCFELASPSCEESLICTVIPVAFLFDRPVGYFWATTVESESDAAEKALNAIVRFYAVVVRSEIAWNALKELAQPIWLGFSTTQRTATELAHSCRRALACSSVVIWEKHTSSQMLRTLAMSGAAQSLQLDMHADAGIAGVCASDSKVIVVDNLQDLDLLRSLGLPKPSHYELIAQQGWKSAVFVPLDVGGRIAGVLAAFAPRARAFAEIDQKIAEAFAQRLCSGYVHGERLRELTDMETRVAIEAPAIEAGIQAMERIHDADNSIFLAQSQLSEITARFRHSPKNPINKSAMAASAHIDHAHKVIRSLVRRAKLKNPVLSPRNLADLIEVAVKELGMRAEGLGVSIYMDCPPDIRIKGDAEQLHRVFVNIIDNALYFLETDRKAGDKRIEISAVRAPKSRAVVTIKDTGPGIPPHSLEQVFDYFFTTRGSRGMGFGLAIARNIIRSHNGSIRARSRWGYETEFIIDFPLLAD